MVQTKHFATGSTKPPLAPGVLRCYNMKFCPFGQRAVMTLVAKKIPHEICLVNMQHKPEWFVNGVTPLGLVSCLEKDGKVILESLGNMEFLDYLYPEYPLRHADPWKRYHDRGLVDVFASKVANHMNMSFYRPCTKEQRIENFGKAMDGMEIFEKELKSRKTKFFGGDEPGFLDYAIWPWFERLPVFTLSDGLTFPRERFPVLAKFIDDMMEVETIKQVYIDPKYHYQVMETYRNSGERTYDIDTNQIISNYVR